MEGFLSGYFPFAYGHAFDHMIHWQERGPPGESDNREPDTEHLLVYPEREGENSQNRKMNMLQIFILDRDIKNSPPGVEFMS